MDVILEVQRGSKRTRSIQLRCDETIVGRREGCDLRIPSSAVSRRHCRLSFHHDYLTVEDLDSANGTFVNGVRVLGQQVVRPGDLLEIGPVTFLVKYQLTQTAIDHLLKEGTAADEETSAEIADVEEFVDVEKVEEPAKAPPSGASKGGGKKGQRTQRRKTTKREPAAEKERTKQPESQEPKPEEEDLPIGFSADDSLKLPAELDLRDILSRLEDDS
jgi:pSer/pThr/pTyr-binding forkhead associated (FHA) protein